MNAGKAQADRDGITPRRLRNILAPALIACALVGCLVPSREAVKEPAWRSSRAGEAGGANELGAGGLIKPFIPPDGAEETPRAGAPVDPSRKIEPVVNAAQPLESPTEVPPKQIDGRSPAVPPQAAAWERRGPAEGAPPEFPPERPQDRAPGLGAPQPTRPDAVPARPLTPAPEQRTQPAPPQSQPPATAGPMDRPQTAQPPVFQVQPAPAPRPESSNRQVSRLPEPAAKPQPAPAPPSTEAKEGGKEWEDHKVKREAGKLAAQFTDVKKAKLCYSVKNDEWWLVLYEDVGDSYDLKKYFWSRNDQKWWPFLVPTRIGKDRLEESLSESEQDRACEPMELDAIPR